MAAAAAHLKKEGFGGGLMRGPPSEEEHKKLEAEFKQAFIDEYRKQYGDSLISSSQTWKLYRTVKDNWRAKMRERHAPPDQRYSSHQQDHLPPHLEEKRKQMQLELQKEFQKVYTVAHGTNKINAEQACVLLQKVKENKVDKLQAEHHKSGHGSGSHRYGPGGQGYGPEGPGFGPGGPGYESGGAGRHLPRRNH